MTRYEFEKELLEWCQPRGLDNGPPRAASMVVFEAIMMAVRYLEDREAEDGRDERNSSEAA